MKHLTGSKEIIEKIKEAIDSDYELSQFKERFYENMITDLVFSDILEIEIKVIVNRICIYAIGKGFFIQPSTCQCWLEAAIKEMMKKEKEA